MCDDTVAFLLNEKTEGGDAASANLALRAIFTPRPLSVPRAAIETCLLSLSASPPLHLLNVTFRN
jgi:hypothetical protein